MDPRIWFWISTKNNKKKKKIRKKKNWKTWGRESGSAFPQKKKKKIEFSDSGFPSKNKKKKKI